MTSDQLFALRHAADCLIKRYEQLHWDMVPLMGKEPEEMGQQLKMTSRLHGEVQKLEEAKLALSQLFESQFESPKK